MEYRNLGNSGVKVSPICLGTAFRGQRDESVCIRTVEVALDRGCNFVDTANVYGRGWSEQMVGKALKGKRDTVVLTSKVGSPMGEGTNERGLSRYGMMREIEDSLKRLQTDHLDVYLIHQRDPTTPIEETLRAMDDLLRQGKTRYIGCCNFHAWEVAEALWVSDRNGLHPFVTVQSQYNLLHRWEIEPELMPLCRKHGLGMITYSPLAIGLLSGHFRRGQPPPEGSLWATRPGFDEAMTEQNDRIVQTLIEIGRGHDKTPAQVAIAWILDHPEITSPIIGPDRPEHAEEAFGALDWKLTPGERATLDEVSKKELKPYN